MPPTSRRALHWAVHASAGRVGGAWCCSLSQLACPIAPQENCREACGQCAHLSEIMPRPPPTETLRLLEQLASTLGVEMPTHSPENPAVFLPGEGAGVDEGLVAGGASLGTGCAAHCRCRGTG